MLTARQRGFNLVEAIVTLAVLGLLTAAAVPNMADWIRSTRVRNLAETTQAGLQRARTEAMKRNQVVTFWLVSPADTARPDDTCALSSASAAWVVSLDNPAGKCATAASTTVAPRIVEVYGPGATSGITVAALAADGTTAASSVSFNGYGLALRTGTPLSSIDITHSDTSVRRLRLQVSASGGVRMCEPAAVSPDPRACI